MMDRLTQNFGFGIIPKQVMKDSSLSIQSKAVYSYLCSYAGNKDTAFPSISLITYELKITKDTFYKYMKELKSREYIETFQCKDKGKFSHSVYKLLPCPKIPCTVKSDTETSYTEDKDTNINSINKNSINKNNNKDTSIKDTSIKDNKYIDIYNYYLSLDIVKHSTFTPAMEKAIKLAMTQNNYSVEDCKTLLQKHKQVIVKTKGNQYAVKKRPLVEFFGQKIKDSTALICTQYETGGKYDFLIDEVKAKDPNRVVNTRREDMENLHN